MFLNFKYLMQKKLSPEIREEGKKKTLRIVMLKLAMLKRFCLKKKKFLVLSDFAPQAVRSVENCVCSSSWPERNQMHDLRRISRSRQLYLQM